MTDWTPRERTPGERTPGERLGRLLPILLSMLVLGGLIAGLLEWRAGQRPEPGREVFIFQLLMTLQLPIIAMYGVISRRRFQQSLPVILLQTGLWLAVVVLAMLLVE